MSFAGPAYLVCCDARTGSSLLSAALRATGRVGKPYEYFSRAEIDKPWLRTDLLHVPDDVRFTGFYDWREYIVRCGSEFGGVFGAPVHYWQLPDCLETFRSPDADPATPALEVLRGFFPNLRLIRLRRANIAAQAISHHVAISTNFWNSTSARGVPPGQTDRGAPYDFDRIDSQVKSVHAANQGWQEALNGAEAITLALAYEDLAADLTDSVRRVCAHVGIDFGDAPPLKVNLEKQAGPWSLELERLYREERRERGLGPVGDEPRL